MQECETEYALARLRILELCLKLYAFELKHGIAFSAQEGYNSGEAIYKYDVRQARDERGRWTRGGYFQTKDDPLREVTGSAFESNPVEAQAILDDCERMGIEIKWREPGGTMAYGPSATAGIPGEISIDREASYGALLHEYTHALRDLRSGWHGMSAVWNKPLHCKWEDEAYGKEIDLAERLERPDIAKRLKELLEAEKEGIWHGQ